MCEPQSAYNLKSRLCLTRPVLPVDLRLEGASAAPLGAPTPKRIFCAPPNHHPPYLSSVSKLARSRVPGENGSLNQSLELAGRVADFLEFGELMCRDALQRAESCGGHFREEHQTEEGEAKRDDENFSFVGAWGYRGADSEPELHKEDLTYEEVKMTQRSYK